MISTFVLQTSTKVKSFDNQDLAFFLVYKHVRSLGMKQLSKQMSKLGISAGLDLSDMSCEFGIKEVMETLKKSKKSSGKSVKDAMLVELVCNYLRKSGQHKLARELAATKKNCLYKSSKKAGNLETIFREFSR